MKRLTVSLGVLFVFALFLVSPMLSQAEVELAEGMTQGDFAFWLVTAIQPQLQGLSAGQHAGVTASVNFLLNPAAGAEESIKFLTDQLALVPEGGWQKDEPLTNEALGSLLEDPEDGEGLGFDELVEKVLERVREKFQEINKKQGVFRVFSATPSLPAGV